MNTTTNVMAEIRAAELPTDLLRIAWNAKGDFAISANPIQLRAVARALAHTVQKVNVFVREDNPKDGEGVIKTAVYRIQTANTGIRDVCTYTVRATAGSQFIRIFTKQGVSLSEAHHVASAWADDQEHRVWMTVVRDQSTGPRLSRANYMRSYARFALAQADAGISPDSPLYVHPLSMMTKDTFIALFGLGRVLGIKGNRKDIIAAMLPFYHDELAEIAGIPYEQRG